MNSDFPQNERAKMEAKLTALLLGELHADEVASLSKAMEADPELAALYERLKVTIELVREGAMQPKAEEQAPLKMSAEKREKLRASFKTVAPQEFARPRRVSDWLMPVAACAAIALVLAAVILPNVKPRLDVQTATAGGRYWGAPQLAKKGKAMAPAAPVASTQAVDEHYYAYFSANSQTAGTEPKRKVPAERPVTTLTIVPVATQEQVASAPVLAPPASVTPIVLPAQQEKADGFNLNVVSLENADPSVVGRQLNDHSIDLQGATSFRVEIGGNGRTNAVAMNERASEAGKFEFMAGKVRSFSDEPGIVAATNGTVGGGQVALNADSYTDGSLAQVSVDGLRKQLAEGTNYVGFDSPGPFVATTGALTTNPEAAQLYFRLLDRESNKGEVAGNGISANGWNGQTYPLAKESYDRAVTDSLPGLEFGKTNYVVANSALRASDQAPVLADLPVLGRLFRSNSTVAQNGEFKTALTKDDVSELGYLGSNAIVTSQPIAGNTTMWDSSKVTTNWAETLDVGDATATNSSAFIGRYAYTVVPSASDGELTSGLRGPAHVGGVVQGENRNLDGIVVQNMTDAPQVSGGGSLALNDESGKEVTDGIGRGGRGGGRGRGNQNSILTTRANGALVMNQTAFGGGGGGGFGGGGGGGQAIQNSGSMNGTQPPGAEKPVEIAAAVNPAKSSTADQSQLKTATIKVDPNALHTSLQNLGTINFGNAATNAQSGTPSFAGVPTAGAGEGRAEAEKQLAVKGFFQAVGVDLDPAKGKSVSFNDQDGTITVRGTEDDLELVQQAAETLNVAPPQVALKSKFAEVNSNDNKQLGFDWYQGNFANGTGAVVASGGTTPAPQNPHSSNGWTDSATTRGFYDDGLNSKAVPSNVYDATIVGYVTTLSGRASTNAVAVTGQAKVEELRQSLGSIAPGTGLPIAAAKESDTTPPKPAVPPPTPQPEVLTRENSFSTFSLNVSDVSFKLAAATLTQGQMPEPGAIRSEEFINAFDYRDPDAAAGVPIAFASERARYPFAHNRELLRFSLKTAAAGRQAGRPLNIVLLLDNSGSMERADRVGIIREALRVLAGQLQAGDTFSVVTFARTAQLRVDGIPGNQAGAAAEEIAKLTPEGGTNLGEALDLAYETARHHYLVNGDNRVVLLTDGAANLGDVNSDTLKQKVEAQRQQGIALDCFGIGWEGLNDDLLEVLTRNGDGRYGFINTPEEANTEFVAQIAGALHVAASDVKVQVEFNPQRVTSYRQIGYAKHQLTKEQFRDNTVDAAEIASQEAGNALYTIETNPEGSGSIATVHVRYKVPGTAEYREQAWDVPYTGGAAALDEASPAMRLAATTCAFSEWLATSPFAAEVSTDQLLRYMSGVPQFYGADTRPAKLEWMIRQAKSISGR